MTTNCDFVSLGEKNVWTISKLKMEKKEKRKEKEREKYWSHDWTKKVWTFGTVS